ncbi:MAG: DUF3347 domain-containing protein [bacterium]
MLRKRNLFAPLLASFLFLFALGSRSAFAVDAKTAATMDEVAANYLNIQEKLAADTTVGIEAEAVGIVKKLSPLLNQPCTLTSDSCMDLLQKISTAAEKMKGNDIKSLRNSFGELSKPMGDYWKKFSPKWNEVYLFQCPMAGDGKGGVWLQRGPNLQNPYFGKAMLSCGSAVK